MSLLVNELDCNTMSIGILTMQNVTNQPSHDGLNAAKQELSESLRTQFAHAQRNDLIKLHPLDAYHGYYKQFGRNYHVLFQLESIIQGKPIPTVSTLVEAMFMAELKNMILSAGHDLEKLSTPLYLRKSTGVENYTSISGKEIATVSGDHMLADSDGVISSILKGPDKRTCITAETRQVLYAAYATSDIPNDLLLQHLNDIEAYVRIFSPESVTQQKEVYL